MAMEDTVHFVVHRNAVVFYLRHFLVEELVRHQGEKFLAAKRNQVVNCNSNWERYVIERRLRWFLVFVVPKCGASAFQFDFEFWWWIFFSLSPPFSLSALSSVFGFIFVFVVAESLHFKSLSHLSNWIWTRTAIQMIRMRTQTQIIQWIQLNQPKGAI